MHVRVQNIKPKYMSELEVSGSDIYLQNEIIFQKGKGYGNALIEGINLINTEYLCIFNADGSFNPN